MGPTRYRRADGRKNVNPPPLLELRDIHAAPPPGFWPPAPGWWIVGLLAVMIVLTLGWLLCRYYRRWRRRRLVFKGLKNLRDTFENKGDMTPLVAELSILLRRVALMRFPRHQVAGLSGAKWLDFLDRTGGGGAFSRGAGKVLANGPYRPRLETDREPLLALVQRWLKKNA
jgi:hypothetical protein